MTTYWPLADALQEDREWGLAAMRQRQLLRLDTFPAETEETGLRPALGELASQMAVRLRSLWGPAAEMPLYPAFRQA